MSEPEVVVALVEDDRALAAAHAIRFEVFVDEQGVPPAEEVDDLDADALHVLLSVDGLPAATGRLVTEPPGHEGLDPGLGPVAHLGRIAVRAVHRGTGLGNAVMLDLEDRARDAGLRVAYLSGQVVAVPFYEKLGYAPYGPVFDDAGIDHRHMTKEL